MLKVLNSFVSRKFIPATNANCDNINTNYNIISSFHINSAVFKNLLKGLIGNLLNNFIKINLNIVSTI
jgi:hypothetical protein